MVDSLLISAVVKDKDEDGGLDAHGPGLEEVVFGEDVVLKGRFMDTLVKTVEPLPSPLPSLLCHRKRGVSSFPRAAWALTPGLERVKNARSCV